MLFVAIGVSCGAEDARAPFVIAPDAPSACPSAAEAFAETHASRALPEMDDLRPHLTRHLVEGGGLRLLVRAMAVLRDAVDPALVARLVHLLEPERGLVGLSGHLREVLRYLGGTSPHIAGEHLEPVTAVQAVLAGCDASRVAGAFRGILALQVNDDEGPVRLVESPITTGAASPPLESRAWLNAVLAAARDVAGDPFVRDALSRITLEGPDAAIEGQGDGGGIRVGRDAFRLLAHLVLADLSAPAYQADQVRALLEGVLLPLIDDAAAQAKVVHLLDVLFLPLDADLEAFPALRETLGCFDRKDDRQAVAGMLYDWLTIEALSVELFAEDLATVGRGEQAFVLRRVLAGVLAGLEQEPSLAADVTRAVAGFLDPATARAAIAAALALQGRGAVAEILRFLQTVGRCADGCDAAVDTCTEPP